MASLYIFVLRSRGIDLAASQQRSSNGRHRKNSNSSHIHPNFQYILKCNNGRQLFAGIIYKTCVNSQFFAYRIHSIQYPGYIFIVAICEIFNCDLLSLPKLADLLA